MKTRIRQYVTCKYRIHNETRNLQLHCLKWNTGHKVCKQSPIKGPHKVTKYPGARSPYVTPIPPLMAGPPLFLPMAEVSSPRGPSVCASIVRRTDLSTTTAGSSPAASVVPTNAPAAGSANPGAQHILHFPNVNDVFVLQTLFSYDQLVLVLEDLWLFWEHCLRTMGYKWPIELNSFSPATVLGYLIHYFCLFFFQCLYLALLL